MAPPRLPQTLVTLLMVDDLVKEAFLVEVQMIAAV
jgi:hypothetical protein